MLSNLSEHTPFSTSKHEQEIISTLWDLYVIMVGRTKPHTFNLPSVFVTCDGKYTPLETEVPASLGQFATNQLVLSVISEHSEENPVVAAAAGLGAACVMPAMKPKSAASFCCCIVTLI
jgi:hypothetical protein